MCIATSGLLARGKTSITPPVKPPSLWGGFAFPRLGPITNVHLSSGTSLYGVLCESSFGPQVELELVTILAMCELGKQSANGGRLDRWVEVSSESEPHGYVL